MNQYDNIVIVTHEATSGPALDLRDYLISKTKNLLFISHPLLYVPSSYAKSSYYELYKNGKLKKKNVAFHFKGPELMHYLKDSILTIYWIVVSGTRWDLYIGNGNLNAFAGLMLKIFRKTKRVVFYCIDYVPKRFENQSLNKFYHWIDRLAVQYCYKTWNLSHRMAEARAKKWGKSFPKQITVPIGAWFERIKRVPFNKVNASEIIFMGGIRETQGTELVIKALVKIKKVIRNIKFVIIGQGPYESYLKKLTAKLKLEDHVDFLGYIEDHREVENRLAKSAIAMAMYNPRNNPFTYYTDPGKVKAYLSAGVPVVITDLPYIAKQVEQKKCGIIVEFSEDSLAKKIIELLKDKSTLKEYRKNAIEFAKEFDWNVVFNKALNE
jgi:glycosyltransferase involved in cell wall biosynthesis